MLDVADELELEEAELREETELCEVFVVFLEPKRFLRGPNMGPCEESSIYSIAFTRYVTNSHFSMKSSRSATERRYPNCRPSPQLPESHTAFGNPLFTTGQRTKGSVRGQSGEPMPRRRSAGVCLKMSAEATSLLLDTAYRTCGCAEDMEGQGLVFTGIVEEIGTIESIEQQAGGEIRLVIKGAKAASDAQLGDSISVSGVCLTAVDLPGHYRFAVEAVPETLSRTTIGELEPGSRVNLERALKADARLGGHIVQGHVDGMGALLSRTDGGRWQDLTFSIPTELAYLVAEKGSITISGVSLTVTAVTVETFSVSLIPATLEATTLGDLEVGDKVNLEVDVLARYVARLMAKGSAES